MKSHWGFISTRSRVVAHKKSLGSYAKINQHFTIQALAFHAEENHMKLPSVTMSGGMSTTRYAITKRVHPSTVKPRPVCFFW